MKYQLQVTKISKDKKSSIGLPVRFKPHLSIKDVAYWQHRLEKLDNNYHYSCVVAK